MSPRQHFANVDEYMKAMPEHVRPVLESLRTLMKQEIPGAEETISYQIPTYKLGGTYVIYFAGFAKHVSVYPIPTGDESFNSAIAPYVKGKGTLQFTLDKPLPMNLIKRVVKQAIKVNQERRLQGKSGYDRGDK